jgi:hypothetical protein
MSALLQGIAQRQVLDSISMTIGTGLPDHVHNGIPYEADGTVAAALTTPTHHHQGLGFDVEGRLCVITADPDYFGSGAAPFLAANAGRLCVQEAAATHYSSGVGYTAGGQVAYTADTPRVLFTATIVASGGNFNITSVLDPASDPYPSSIDGEVITYLGSFGQNFWNARFGVAGQSKIFNANAINVSLGAAAPADLDWSVGQLRYQGTAGEDLWAILGADLGNEVDFTVNTLGPDLIDGAVADSIAAGWVYNGDGTYTADGTQIGQLRWGPIGIIAGRQYRINFEIITTTIGSLSSKLNGVLQGMAHTGVGSYSDTYSAADNDGMQILGQSFIGTIGTPTVREV